MDKIIEEYRNLFHKLNKSGRSFVEKDMAAFNARSGKNYKNELMIVGRAVNGWIYNFSKNKDGIITEKDIENTIGNLSKDLVVEHNLIDETIYNIPIRGNRTKNYNPNTSAFCRVKQILAKEITGGKINEANNSIVWSNLYKISNGHGGNPSSKLKKAQEELCKKILKQEIDYFKPKIIIFLTGKMAIPFLDFLEIKNALNLKMEYVEFAGIYNDSLVIVGKHPQGKKEPPHVNEILLTINSFGTN